MTTLVTEREIYTQVPPPETSNDKPNSAHIVRSPNADETNHAYVLRARIEGFVVVALCGYQFIPYQNAAVLPVCEECKQIWDALPGDDDDEFPRE